MNRLELEAQLSNGCRRLAGKGFLTSLSDSLSVRIPGTNEMMFAASPENWRDQKMVTIATKPFTSEEALAGLHGLIYLERPDVGAVAISSPTGARLLADSGDILPSLFDEQVRQIGPSSRTRLDENRLSKEQIHRAFSRGTNAALLGQRLLCLGMTCERVIFNTELFEKCAQAYVIARASGARTAGIPAWVRLIANRRLGKDEIKAAASYREGRLPDATSAY